MRATKIATITFILLSLLVSSSSAIASTMYLRSDTHTVNGQTAYVLGDSQTTASAYASVTSVDVADGVQCGWRVWIVYNSTGTTELTNGSPQAIVNRSSSGEGTQSNTWTNTANTTLNVGFDALMVKLYMRMYPSDWGDWQVKATWITTPILKKTVLNSTWTFYVYTKRNDTAFFAYGYALWGNSTVNTRIEGLSWKAPEVYDEQGYYLTVGNFFQFLILPYIRVIGSVFYGFITGILLIPLYMKTRKVLTVLVLFSLFGSTGGLLTLIMAPVVEIQLLLWIILWLMLGSVIYGLTR